MADPIILPKLPTSCCYVEVWEDANAMLMPANQPYYTADQLRAHAAAVSAAKDKEIAALRERVRVLEDALRKACDDMEVWGLYAPEYFREKHDFVGDVEAARAALEQKP